MSRAFLPEDRGRMPPPRLRDLGAALGLVALTAAAALGARALLPPTLVPPEILPLVFLVAVLISAVAFGFWSGLAAAVLAFGGLNFLFTEPLYTLHVARIGDLVALVEFLIVAALSGLLAGRLHDRAQAASTRAEALAVLGDLSAALALAPNPDAALDAALAPLGRLARGAAILVTPQGLHPSSPDMDAATLAALDRARRSGQVQPAAAPGWEGSRLTFLPLAEGLLLGHAPLSGREAPMRERAIAALAQQLRLALQRLDFATRARAEGLRAEAEAARAAVLTSLGHDLRTPLATILGAASSLRDLDLPPDAQADLLTAIIEEAGRLNAHVSNLMQLSRLELSAPPRRDWVDVNDMVSAAATRIRRAASGAGVGVDLTLTLADLPMIQSAGGLIEQAVFNLIDNALIHGRGAVSVQTCDDGGGHYGAAHDGGGHDGGGKHDGVQTHGDGGAQDAERTLSIIVTDAGPGLPEPLSVWLKGPDLRPAPGQGGLGLAVAKGIARHLGGDLTHADRAFTLTLPKAP